jgi:HPt (histidine-containing phosphotransfer) domain-containing protein
MSEKVFDRTALLNRVLGDEDLAREVIAVFLGDIPNKIKALRLALDSRDASQMRDQAHAVKGAARNISAAALGDVAFQMEQAGESADMNKAVPLMAEIEEQFKVLKNTLVQSGLC